MPEIRKPQKQPNDKPVVFIIDDDPSMRESLADLFLSMQFDAEAFETAAAFMAKFPDQSRMERPGCILIAFSSTSVCRASAALISRASLKNRAFACPWFS